VNISAVPFIRLTAVAGIALIVATFVLEITGHEQKRPPAIGAPTQDAVAVGGLTYESPESRPLDPSNPVDRAILRGVPPVRRPLPRSEEWFGVFLTVSNPGRHVLSAARRFTLVDVDGRRFRPEHRLADDAYAYRPTTVPPGRSYPPAASAAARNLTAQGALVLFRIPRASDDFGSLELRIADPAGRQPPADLAVS
jgi:hypothetical protein